MNHFCNQAIIMSSSTFAQRGMDIQADRDAKADRKMISQTVVFRRVHIQPQSYDVLQCPIRINGSIRVKWQVYMKLVRYNKLSRCSPRGIVLINFPFDSRVATVLKLSRIDISLHLHQTEKRQHIEDLALVPETKIPSDESENTSDEVREAMRELRVGVRHPLMVRMDKHAVAVESKSSSESESKDIEDLNVNNPTMDSEKKETGDESESTNESTSEDIQHMNADNLMISEKRRAGDESKDTNPEEHEGDVKYNRPPSVPQTEESNDEWENSGKSTEKDFRHANANSLTINRERNDVSDESQFIDAVESFSSASEDTDFHDSSFDNPSITHNSPPSFQMIEIPSEESQYSSLDDEFSSAQTDYDSLIEN